MKTRLALLSSLFLLAACDTETDKIGRADTVFNLLGKNDRIEIEGFDDPDVRGVTCYLSYAKKGGLKETINFEEDASDASVSCVQTAPQIEFNQQIVSQPRKIFKRSADIGFKSLQIIRYYDSQRQVFTYLAYSDKLIEGSPKNSLSAISCHPSPQANSNGNCIIR